MHRGEGVRLERGFRSRLVASGAVAGLVLAVVLAATAAFARNDSLWAALVLGVLAVASGVVSAAEVSVTYWVIGESLETRVFGRTVRTRALAPFASIAYGRVYLASTGVVLRRRDDPPAIGRYLVWRALKVDDGDVVLGYSELVGTQRATDWARVMGLALTAPA